MKNLPSIIAAVVLAAVLVLFACTYQVRSTEVAILKTFGQVNREPIEITDADTSFFAGLHFKWPWPIQSVEKYDKRLRLLEDRIEETPTRDSKQIIVTTYAIWKISDPYRFHTRYQTVEAGEAALRDRLRSYKKAVIGGHDFSDFVSTEKEQRKLKEIEAQILNAVRTGETEPAAEVQTAEATPSKDAPTNLTREFGIAIESFGIKQLTLPKSVTEAVFTTMKTTQEIKAQKYKAEGRAEAQKIVARANEARERIMSVVDRKVKGIEGDAQAQIGVIYKEFRDHEDLKIFLDKLTALKEIIRNRAEIIMDTEFVPADIFDEQKRLEGIQSAKTEVEAATAASNAEAPSALIGPESTKGSTGQ